MLKDKKYKVEIVTKEDVINLNRIFKNKSTFIINGLKKEKFDGSILGSTLSVAIKNEKDIYTFDLKNTKFTFNLNNKYFNIGIFDENKSFRFSSKISNKNKRFIEEILKSINYQYKNEVITINTLTKMQIAYLLKLTKEPIFKVLNKNKFKIEADKIIIKKIFKDLYRYDKLKINEIIFEISKNIDDENKVDIEIISKDSGLILYHLESIIDDTIYDILNLEGCI